MQSKDVSNALTYVSNKPDINVLKGAYDQTTNELEGYFDNCRNNYDIKYLYIP